MQYQENPPNTQQKDYVECFWHFDAGRDLESRPDHVIVPDGSVSLTVVRLPNGQLFFGVTGPSMRAHSTPLMSGALYGGVRFRPGTAGAILGCNIKELRDAFGPIKINTLPLVRPLQSHLPATISPKELPQTLSDIADFAIDQATPLDRHVCQYANEISKCGGAILLGLAAEDFDISVSQLRRRFAYQCGLSPKEFARLRRVRKACITMLAQSAPRFAHTAGASGYFDQAHMSRDFAEIFGNSTALVDSYLRQIEHSSELFQTL